jgi:hypothetical protein
MDTGVGGEAIWRQDRGRDNLGAMRRLCIVLLLSVAACRDDQPAVGRDSVITAAPDTAAAPESPTVSSGWDERAGPALLIAGERAGEAIVIHPHLQGTDSPDTLEVEDFRGSSATLIARRGVVGTSSLSEPPALPDDAACTVWPRLAVSRELTGWTAGFLRPDLTAISIDSVTSMAPRDSTRFVSSIARLASSLPGLRSGIGAQQFSGLPFAVKEAGRFTVQDAEVAVAHIVRRVNQEANPLEEHTMIILERAPGADGWTAAHAEHAVGPEETVERPELLGVVQLDGRPTLVLAHDGGEGVVYSLMRREGPRTWRTLWRSARPPC